MIASANTCSTQKVVNVQLSSRSAMTEWYSVCITADATLIRQSVSPLSLMNKAPILRLLCLRQYLIPNLDEKFHCSLVFLLLHQVQVLPECVQSELLLCVVGLAPVGAGNRLDGTQWPQPAPGLHWAGSFVARGLVTMFQNQIL